MCVKCVNSGEVNIKMHNNKKGEIKILRFEQSHHMHSHTDLTLREIDH